MPLRRDGGSQLCCGAFQSLENIATEVQWIDGHRREVEGWRGTVSSAAGLSVTCSFLCLLIIQQVVLERRLCVRCGVRDECSSPVPGLREVLAQREREAVQRAGAPGGSGVECLPSAQGMTPGSQGRVPHRAPCMKPASPSACVSASLSVSLIINKYFKKEEEQTDCPQGPQAFEKHRVDHTGQPPHPQLCVNRPRTLDMQQARSSPRKR